MNDVPTCATCGRRHWPFYGCITSKPTRTVTASEYAAELGDLALHGIKMGSERWATHYARYAWHYAEIALDEGDRVLTFELEAK